MLRKIIARGKWIMLRIFGILLAAVAHLRKERMIDKNKVKGMLWGLVVGD